MEPTNLLCPWISPGRNTGVGYHPLLQGIFPTQGSSPGLLHCRQILYHLSHQGSPCRWDQSSKEMHSKSFSIHTSNSSAVYQLSEWSETLSIFLSPRSKLLRMICFLWCLLQFLSGLDCPGLPASYLLWIIVNSHKRYPKMALETAYQMCSSHPPREIDSCDCNGIHSVTQN